MSEQSPDAGWQQHASDLAAFACSQLFVRTDAYGEFLPGKHGVTQKAPVTEETLIAHFRGDRCVGAHTTSTANESRFGALDLDEDTNPRNEEAALGLAQRFRDLGFAVLLEESRPRRFHLLIRFDKPVSTPPLFALLRSIAQEAAAFGLREPEVFPRQAMLVSSNGDGPYGNWLRLPGKHPELGTWSRIFDPETDTWLEGADAAVAILEWRASSPTALPAAANGDSSPLPVAALTVTGAITTSQDAAIPQGHRNDTLARLAGSMRRVGFSADAISAALFKTNQERCRPPLTMSDVARIARSIGRYDPAAPVEASVITGSSPASGNRFRDASITDTALFALDIKKPVSILGDGLFPATEYAMLCGRPGVGKSWLMDQLAYAMARGDPWHGIPTTKGRVGIISLEMAEYYRRERLHRITGGSPTGDIVVITIDRLGGSIIDLLDPRQQRELIDWALGEGLKLVLIDPLALAFSGSDTDEAAVGPLVSFMREFPIRTGAGLMPVHHEPKPSQGVAIADDLAALRGLAKLGDLACLVLRFREQKDGHKKLLFGKVRYATEPEPIWFTQDAHGVPVRVDVPLSTSEEIARRREKVLALVREHPALNSAEIHRRLRSAGETVADKTIERDLEALEETDRVRSTKAPRGKSRVWIAVPKEERKGHAS